MTAKLITKAQMKALLKNGQLSREAQERGQLFDPQPVVKLFTPDAQATWLLTEIDVDTPQAICFGLCDLGMGFPELGSVFLSEIKEARGSLGLAVERDLHFKANRPISEYSKAAHAAGQITV